MMGSVNQVVLHGRNLLQMLHQEDSSGNTDTRRAQNHSTDINPRNFEASVAMMSYFRDLMVPVSFSPLSLNVSLRLSRNSGYQLEVI